MKKNYIISLLFLAATPWLTAQVSLPLYDKQQVTVEGDWLADPVQANTAIYRTEEGHLVFANGLVSRTFTLQPNVATVGLEELGTNTSYLRSVRPEASLSINGFHFDVGGLLGQPVHNYLLKEWVPSLTADPATFRMAAITMLSCMSILPGARKVC